MAELSTTNSNAMSFRSLPLFLVSLFLFAVAFLLINNAINERERTECRTWSANEEIRATNWQREQCAAHNIPLTK